MPDAGASAIDNAIYDGEAKQIIAAAFKQDGMLLSGDRGSKIAKVGWHGTHPEHTVVDFDSLVNGTREALIRRLQEAGGEFVDFRQEHDYSQPHLTNTQFAVFHGTFNEMDMVQDTWSPEYTRAIVPKAVIEKAHEQIRQPESRHASR